ncbi:MAG: hypothetical protein ABSA39_16070 [Edaphobacter sp.]
MVPKSSDSAVQASASTEAPASGRTWLVSATSLFFIILQSACTAVIAISGVRVAIGLSALAEATIGIHAPASGFHQDAIRIPMMIAATAGSLINLYVIWRIRRLRAQPSSQWRAKAVAPKQRRSELLQILLAIVTLMLVAAEWITHPMVHRVP